ncbi:hypothetical protein NP493_1345g00017 [Ridgeia piscesae]|uniref:Transcriptional adapter n=1 Tax=Ridgeia piscesae TaxID=27915 RepID=A0AAD9K6N5_RIDPI|nr:hypothetical protein NP493_1345g00017 [Ridgeia piscesae]
MAKYRCTYCQNAILTCRIKCIECADFDLCLQCFACGVEASPHKKEHDYQVFDDGGFPIFTNHDSWVASEDESLLEAVEQYGFGNWEDVANHVKTKNAQECTDHYYAYYIQGNIGKVTFPKESASKTIDHTCLDGGPLSPTLTKPLPPADLTLDEQHILGYMPLRDDFEREYDNDAETLVSSLSHNYDDDELELEFKLAQIDMYRQRLKERQRWKVIAREFGLLQNACSTGLCGSVTNNNSNRKTPNKKKSSSSLSSTLSSSSLSKEEKEVEDRLRVFARFHTALEHQQTIDSLRKERRIKSKIKELMKYRRNGITKYDECAQFDVERMKRERKKENKKKMGNLTSLVKRNSMASKKGVCQERRKDGGGVDITTGDNDCKYNAKVAALPSSALLSEREKKLCHSIAMKPSNYITIKTCIVRDYLHRRQGIPVKIRFPNHLDKTHRRKILGFLSENGWISGIGSA